MAQRARLLGSATKANARSAGESIEIVWVLDRMESLLDAATFGVGGSV
jgi:hypothetical protein